MALFLSTFSNKIDAKGRVSVPATFRAELSQENFQGVVLFKSNAHPCLEGFAWSYMQQIRDRLDDFDMFSAAQDDLATSIFGASVQLPIDKDGRIILPQDLMEFSCLKEKASFVGMGAKFQIWNPQDFATRQQDARQAVQSHGLTIPKNKKDGDAS